MKHCKHQCGCSFGKTPIGIKSRPEHYWLGPDNAVVGALPSSTEGHAAASLASAYWTSTSSQPKMSPDIVTCPLGGGVAKITRLRTTAIDGYKTPLLDAFRRRIGNQLPGQLGHSLLDGEAGLNSFCLVYRIFWGFPCFFCFYNSILLNFNLVKILIT